MGAHEAGRVACHASSPEWAVKSATCTFLSMQTDAFLRLCRRFLNAYASPLQVSAAHGAILRAWLLKLQLLQKNRITPPSPHCLRLWSVLPCCVASRTVFCCRDRLQFTDEALQGDYRLRDPGDYGPLSLIRAHNQINNSTRALRGYHIISLFRSEAWFVLRDLCVFCWWIWHDLSNTI